MRLLSFICFLYLCNMEKRTLFRALKEVGAFRAYQLNMNTGKFRWTEIERAPNPYSYINSSGSFDWMKTIQGWDFWNKVLDDIWERENTWSRGSFLEQ